MKPETELPWETNGLVVHGGKFHDQVAKADILGSLDAMQNAAYIVHAANAYPKLIKALKLFAACHESRVAVDLLRELGEEA